MNNGIFPSIEGKFIYIHPRLLLNFSVTSSSVLTKYISVILGTNIVSPISPEHLIFPL